MNRRSLLSVGALAGLVSAVKTRLTFAQSAPLVTPVAQASLNNYRPESLTIQRNTGGSGTPSWNATVGIYDSGGNVLRYEGFQGPRSATDAATAGSLVTQLLTAVSGETGGNARRFDARFLEFLRTNHSPGGPFLPPTTLVP